MFETWSHFGLQQYWWIIIALLGGALGFLMFVQGGQTLIYTLGKSETERKMLVNSLGRKWEYTFTTLVTFGGAFFASFPLFYATSFGGAYWVWMIILFAFVIQAVSYEFRTKPNNWLGKRTFEVFLFINGALGTILIGAAIATFFTGSEFFVSDMNNSVWKHPARGLEAALNLQNLSLGLAVFFLARTLGILYFINDIDDDAIIPRARKHLMYNAIPFVVFFLVFVVWLMLKEGFAYHPETGEVFMQDHKYWHNFTTIWWNSILFLVGVVLVLWGIGRGLFTESGKGIWLAGAGTALTVFALFIMAGFNNTAFYPSTYDLQSSLTIRNASSSHYTLTAMSYVSLFVPFVFAYIFYAWRSLGITRITQSEMEGDGHSY